MLAGVGVFLADVTPRLSLLLSAAVCLFGATPIRQRPPQLSSLRATAEAITDLCASFEALISGLDADGLGGGGGGARNKKAIKPKQSWEWVSILCDEGRNSTIECVHLGCRATNKQLGNLSFAPKSTRTTTIECKGRRDNCSSCRLEFGSVLTWRRAQNS